MKLIKDFEYVTNSYPSMGKVVTDVLHRKSSSSFVQIRAIHTSIQDELRSWMIELMIDGNDFFLVNHLKVRPIQYERIQEVQNIDLTMVRLKNYIDT